MFWIKKILMKDDDDDDYDDDDDDKDGDYDDNEHRVFPHLIQPFVTLLYLYLLLSLLLFVT